MGSINDEEHYVAKPKIDLLLKEINEVKNRESEYLAHIRALYPDKCKNTQDDTDNVTEEIPSKTVNNLHEKSRNDNVNRQYPIKINNQSAKNISNSTVITSSIMPQNAFASTSYKNRIFQGSNKKGIMHQFYTSRGKIAKDQRNGNSLNSAENGAFADTLSLTVQTKIERDDFGKPIRKGYIPVEEKIHQELKDLQTREKELKLLRKENSINGDTDESDSEFEIQMNGKIRPSKSIGELYEALWQTSSKGDMETYRKNSVSLAQLCDLNGNENDVISSHKLIEKWECLIQERKQQNIG